MHHIYRQITGFGGGWRTAVVAQKVENIERFPFPALRRVRRSPWRSLDRAIERHLTRRPWQISQRESARILETLTDLDAALVHIFFGNAAVHLLPLIESLPIPCVVSFHGADVTGEIATANYADARAAMFRGATLVACRSEALILRVEQLGCPREKLRVLRTAIPEIGFELRELPGDGAIRIVQACRLIPKKGVATSLRAFAQFAETRPAAEFHVAGDGPLRGELAALARSLGIEAKVRFTGFLGQDDLRALFASAHLFLHPSETVDGDVEGVPNSLIEAMAAGIPVVATRHGGIPEAVDHGRNGLLVAERSPDAVAGALEFLVADPAAYSLMSDAAAASARAKFSRSAQRAAAAAIYGEAAELHRRKAEAAGRVDT